jgi:hypothetical protein
MPSFPPYNDRVSDADGQRLLTNLLTFHRHNIDDVLVPPRLPLETVDQFLADNVKPSLTGEAAEHIADVAHFYHRTASVPLFQALLTGNERSDDDLRRSIEALRAIGNLGDADAQKAAADYYLKLLAHPRFDTIALPMIELLFHLSPVPPQPPADALQARIARLLAHEQDKDDPSPFLLAARRNLASDLPATLAARAAKDKLPPLAEPAARAKPLARFYLGLDNVGQANWVKWSASELMAIVLATGAPPGNTTPVNAALHAALAAIPPKDPEEFRTLATGRGVKALNFFAAKLTPEEQTALDHDNTRRFQLQG